MKKKQSCILCIVIVCLFMCIWITHGIRIKRDNHVHSEEITSVPSTEVSKETKVTDTTEKATEAVLEASTEISTETEKKATKKQVKEAVVEQVKEIGNEPTEKVTENPAEDSSEKPDLKPELLPLIPSDKLTAANAVSNSALIEELKKNWKVQLPVLRDGSTTAVKEVGKGTDIPFDGYCDEWFYYDPADDAIVFYTLVQGAKTANTTYTRSELREMMGDKTSDNWNWEGYHTLQVTEKVTQVPENGKTMVCQVHSIYPDGTNGPVPLKVIYQGNEKRLEVTFTLKAGSNGTKAYYFEHVELGQEFSVKMEFINHTAYVTVESEGRTETYGHDFYATDKAGWSQYHNYFKAGNYIQDNTDNAEGAGSVVRLYRLHTTHNQDSTQNPVYKINDLQLAQSEVTMQIGERTQLGVSFVPLQTSNKQVVWSVDDGMDIVAIDKDGYIIAIAEGCATVSVCSQENPALKRLCNITVTEVKEEPAEIIYEQKFEKDGLPISLEETGFVLKGANLLNVEEEDGNYFLHIKDNAADLPGQITYAFAPVNGPVTLSLKIKVNAIEVKDATTAKPKVSYTYVDLQGSDSTEQTPVFLSRFRNNSELSGTVVDSTKNRWGVTKNYEDAPLNREKSYFNLGEWVELTMITTPADGSADANTTTYYMNGYKLGNQLANANEKNDVSAFVLNTGTKDLMDISVDDIRIYKGKVLPKSQNKKVPTELKVETVPTVMAAGDSYKINAYVSPADAYEDIIFEVLSGEALAVNKEGYIIAIKAGSSIIRVSSTLEGADVYKDIPITVMDADNFVSVAGISLTDANGSPLGEKLLLAPEKQTQLAAVFQPETATDKTLLYEVLSGKEIISVSEQGLLCALKSGNAVIRVTSASNPKVYCDLPIVVVKDFAAGTILFKDSFDGELDKSFWTITSQNAGNTITQVKDGVLSFVDNNSSGQPKSYVTFEPICGAVTIRFKLRIEDDKLLDNGKTSSVRISVGSGDITKTAQEAFTLKNTAKVTDGITISDRQFQYSLPNKADGSGVFQKVSSFELGEWTDIAMVVRTNDGTEKANTSDLYINGTKVTPENGTDNKVVYDVLDKICFATGSSDLTAYSIDSLIITAGEYDAEEPDAVLKHAQNFEDESSIQIFTGQTLPKAPGIRYWDGTDIVSAIKISDEKDHGNALYMKDESTQAQSRILYSFEKISGTFTLSFDMKVIKDSYADTKSSITFTLGDSSIGLVNSDANELFRVKWNPEKNNALQLRGGKTNSTDAIAESILPDFAYTTGIWQNYKMVINTKDNMVAVYVDGQKLTESGKMKLTGFTKAFEGVDHIIFSTVKAEKFEAWIDNFEIYEGSYTFEK